MVIGFKKNPAAKNGISIGKTTKKKEKPKFLFLKKLAA
jgi:hypothetical protein